MNIDTFTHEFQHTHEHTNERAQSHTGIHRKTFKAYSMAKVVVYISEMLMCISHAN